MEFIAPATSSPAPACYRGPGEGRQGGDIVDALGFGHQCCLEMLLQMRWILGGWKGLGRLKQSPQVLGLPPASRGSRISGAWGQPLQEMEVPALEVHSRSLVRFWMGRRAEMRQARGVQNKPLPRALRGGVPAQSLLQSTGPPLPQSGGRGRARTSSHVTPKIDLINHRN